MKRLSRWIVPALLLVGLVACGPPRKSVFPPTITVQELHVQADGHWRMQLRIQNNSYGSMDFTALHLAMQVDKQAAGTIDAGIDLDIPALSVDIAEVDMQPTPGAAAAFAALAAKGGRSAVNYSLDGTATGQPEQEKKPRVFNVSGHDWLSPVPGIADTYR
jgi:hypothetical protein